MTMKVAVAALAVVAGVIAAQSPDTLDVVLRYAVEFGGSFGACVVALVPLVLRVLKRLDQQDDSLAALHDRMDRGGMPMSPGRVLGQRRAIRTRSGSFRAVLVVPPSSPDDKTPGTDPDKGK